MYRGEDETGGQQMKCKNGQIEAFGDSYAKVDPKLQKQHKEEEELNINELVEKAHLNSMENDLFCTRIVLYFTILFL
jgi:hypothetical protein